MSLFSVDILVESEVVAAASVKTVLLGKHYNCCIWSHRLVFEAMHRLRLLAFHESLEESESENLGINWRQITYAFWREYASTSFCWPGFYILENCLWMLYPKVPQRKSNLCILVYLHRNGAHLIGICIFQHLHQWSHGFLLQTDSITLDIVLVVGPKCVCLRACILASMSIYHLL